MRAKTRIFGEIDIPQDKIITMEKGMIGFSELKNYTLIYNSEKENDKKSIMWLQSMDDGDIAFPVMTPDIIMPDYKPTVNEELLAPLGDLNEENMYVIVTVNVPSDITKIACNLKAPIVVNTDSNKAAQLIVEIRICCLRMCSRLLQLDGRNELHGLCDLLSTCNTAFSALYVSHRSHFTTCLLLISNRLTELLFAFLDCLYKCLLRIIVHHLFLPDCFRNLRISGINEIKQLCLES